MRYSILGAVLLAIVILPAGAADKGDKKNSKYKAKPEDYDALVQARVAVGKVSDLGGTDKTFTLQFQYQYLVANNKAKGNAQVRSLLRQQDQVLRTIDPIKRLERLERLVAQAQRLQLKGIRNPFKVKNGRKDFDLRGIDEVKVRVMQLPVEYDDQGKVKKYTPKELKELKGKDPNLPGYTSSWDQVANSQTVKVYLLPKKKKKDQDKATDAAKDKAQKEEDKNADETDDDYRPQVKMIVILKDPNTDDSSSKKDKKG